MDTVNHVDICCGLAWGDEAKGKITSELKKFINNLLMKKCSYIVNIEYSNNPYKINMISFNE